jgi:ribonucleoside-diphosphate reductase alpha chain
MQFDTTINAWHTCPNSGRINASNPCSEYMHLDNSACNLASLNLMKFVDDAGDFDTEAFRHAVDVMITAQDIIVDNSSYPTAEITANAKAYRELGLGTPTSAHSSWRWGCPTIRKVAGNTPPL